MDETHSFALLSFPPPSSTLKGVKDETGCFKLNSSIGSSRLHGDISITFEDAEIRSHRLVGSSNQHVYSIVLEVIRNSEESE